MKYPAFVLSAILILCASASAGAAEEASLKEAYGLVKSIEGNKMTVTVIDTAASTTSDQTFTLSPETKLVIVRPASEVVVGDEIRINYKDEKDSPAEFISILDLPKPEVPSGS